MINPMFATLTQQELYDFLIEAKNAWNERYEEQQKNPPSKFDQNGIPIINAKRMKKAYLHFEEPLTGKAS